MLHSQVPILASPNPAEAPAAEPFQGSQGEAYLTHLLGDTATYRWTRTVLQLQGGSECFSGVADKYITYVPFLDSYTFDLGPNEEDFPLFVYLINQDTIPCCALVHLVVHPEGDTTNTLTIAYSFGDCLTNAKEPEADQVVLYPNPAQSHFTLTRLPVGTALQLFDSGGRLIRTWKGDSGPFDVQDLTAGNYILVLLDPNGRPFQALKLTK